MAGLVSGLGAATADALYGIVAALGLTAITHALLAHQAWLQAGGGAFLVYLGATTLRAAPSASAARPAATTSLRSAYFSVLALTLTNPMTILSFLGIFAGIGLGAGAPGVLPAGGLVLGVFLGSAVWWLLLSTAAGWIGRRLQHGGLRAINVGSGLVIASYGVWQLGRLL